jgi:hypothetical protein
MSTCWSKNLTRAVSFNTLARNCSKVMDHSTSSDDCDAMSCDDRDVAERLDSEAWN